MERKGNVKKNIGLLSLALEIDASNQDFWKILKQREGNATAAVTLASGSILCLWTLAKAKSISINTWARAETA